MPGSIRGWKRVSQVKKVKENERIQLDTAGQDFRYYLLWISELPPQNKANVLELEPQALERGTCASASCRSTARRTSLSSSSG